MQCPWRYLKSGYDVRTLVQVVDALPSCAYRNASDGYVYTGSVWPHDEQL